MEQWSRRTWGSALLRQLPIQQARPAHRIAHHGGENEEHKYKWEGRHAAHSAQHSLAIHPQSCADELAQRWQVRAVQPKEIAVFIDQQNFGWKQEKQNGFPIEHH